MKANISAGCVPREGWRTVLNAIGDTRLSLVDRAGSHHTRIQLDFTKRALVTGNILLQDRGQRFGLLRAQINTLEIADFHLGFALLLQRTEYQKEIPDIDSYLHAVGIVLAVFAGIDQLDVGLRWIRHREVSLAGVRREKKAGSSGMEAPEGEPRN